MSKSKVNWPRRSSSRSWPSSTILLVSFLVPALAAVLVYQLDSFDPAAIPITELPRAPALTAPLKNDRILQGSEFVGAGKLAGPEDIAYDEELGVIYAGCADGWIKRVTANDSVVEDWVNTGGRPLGVALGHKGELIVADAFKGLLKISRGGEVEILTNEADGQKFKLTNGVDIAQDGTIYFSDASNKYNFKEVIFDFLEGKPHGRLISFDPSSKNTQVLVRDLYFANGVAVSPHQDYVVFCETPLARCKKYYIQGAKKGRTENFIAQLPGIPDNIHYDGDGHYLIALATEMTSARLVALRYPIIRKIVAIIPRYIGRIDSNRNAGVMVVDMEGQPVAHYCDLDLRLVSSGIKIGNHLYCGSVIYPHIVHLDLAKHPARSTT